MKSVVPQTHKSEKKKQSILIAQYQDKTDIVA